MPRKGYKQTPEAIAKRAESMRRHYDTPGARERRSAMFKSVPRTEEWCRKLSESHLGKTLSAETRAKMSAAKRGKPGRLLSQEERAAISARMRGTKWSDEQREKLTGRNSPHWGKTPQHRERVRYNGISFRSSWEVRVAQALDRRGIAWEYEKHRFDLGECTYLPDFFLPELGCYWEVKGWLDASAKRKAELFRSMHPETPLVVITKPALQLVEN